MTRLARRLRRAGLWWSLPDIGWAPLAKGWLLPDLPHDHFYSEFYDALQDGFFGTGRRTRVLLVSREFGVWRLTPERARLVLEKDGGPEFVRVYASRAWIEIDTAHHWFQGWLNGSAFRDWMSYPPIRQALEVAAKAQPIWRAPRFGGASKSVMPTGSDD